MVEDASTRQAHTDANVTRALSLMELRVLSDVVQDSSFMGPIVCQSEPNCDSCTRHVTRGSTAAVLVVNDVDGMNER